MTRPTAPYLIASVAVAAPAGRWTQVRGIAREAADGLAFAYAALAVVAVGVVTAR